MTNKLMESRARNRAMWNGLEARKSRRRLSERNHGGFALFDREKGVPVAGFQYEMTPEDVLAYCALDEALAARTAAHQARAQNDRG